ncbi:MAG: ATP-binding protein [Desertimonas sp.]
MTEPTGSARRGWVALLRRLLAGIRLRIVAGYVVLMLAALLIAALITRQVQMARVDEDIDRAQAQEIEELRLLAEGVDPNTGDPFGGDTARLLEVFMNRNVPSDDEAFYSIVGGSRHMLSFDAPELFDDPGLLSTWRSATAPTRDRSGIAGVGEVRSLAVPVIFEGAVSGVFVVAHFPDEAQGAVDRTIRVVALAGLAVLLLTTAVAWSIAGRILRPVRELSATARRITETDLSARIPVDGHDELAQLGDTVNDMLGRLEAGFAGQRRFLDDVAHELRTPITIARGHLEFIGDDADERAETVSIVTDELDRMSRFVSDLLTIAKAEQPDFLDLRPVDVGELLTDIHSRLSALGERDWRLDSGPAPGVFAVTADGERLRQVLLNLAANARQHTAPGDEIGLGARVDHSGGEVAMWVRDTGPGVDPELDLFGRFQRGADSQRSRPEGVGIGLSIVDAIARAHGGRVDLVSSPSGSTFSVVVPIPPAERADTTSPPPPSPADPSTEEVR